MPERKKLLVKPEPAATKEPRDTPEFVRDVSVAVYRERLGERDTAHMIANEGEAALRSHAGAYDALTRAYIKAVRSRGGTVV